MNIMGLQGLRFSSSDVEEGRRFLREWNLIENADGSFSTQEGSRISVDPSDDATLPPASGHEVTIREIVWAVDGQDALDEIESALSKRGEVKKGAGGSLHAIDPNGYGVAFQLSTLRQLPPVVSDVNVPGAPVRRNRAVEFDGQPQVRHLGHVAIFVPDIGASIRFYTEVLGFRTSDVYPGRGIFLRAAGSHDHHNIFLVHRGPMKGFHHMSFEVADFHDVILGGTHMGKRGFKTQTGPGRHRLGSNYFWYFHTPFGGAAEYYSDMDYLDDSWQTRSWDYSPQMVSAWNTEMIDLSK